MLNEPTRLMLMIFTKASSGKGPFLPTVVIALPVPAQLMSTRSGPFASAFSKAALASASLQTSPITAIPPISFATFSAPSLLRSNTVTFAPRSASSFAVAAPSPEPPPVTKADAPFRFICCPLLMEREPLRARGRNLIGDAAGGSGSRQAQAASASLTSTGGVFGDEPIADGVREKRGAGPAATCRRARRTCRAPSDADDWAPRAASAPPSRRRRCLRAVSTIRRASSS